MTVNVAYQIEEKHSHVMFILALISWKAIRMGPGIKGYLPILLGAKYLTTLNHILSYHND